MENKMITESGEKLTEEIQNGIEAASTESGFEYKKSPMEMFSKVGECEANLNKLEELINSSKNKSELVTHSKIRTFDELLAKIPEIVKKAVVTDNQALVVIKNWLSDFESADSEEGVTRALNDLHTELTSTRMDKDEFMKLSLDLNNALMEYYDSTGELFYFCSTPGSVGALALNSDTEEVLEINDDPILPAIEPDAELVSSSNDGSNTQIFYEPIIERLKSLGFTQATGEPDFVKLSKNGEVKITISDDSISGYLMIDNRIREKVVIDTESALRMIDEFNNEFSSLSTFSNKKVATKSSELKTYSNNHKHRPSITEVSDGGYSAYLSKLVRG